MTEEAKAEIACRLKNIQATLKRMSDSISFLDGMLYWDDENTHEWPEDAAIVLDEMDGKLNDFGWENWMDIDNLCFDVIHNVN